MLVSSLSPPSPLASTTSTCSTRISSNSVVSAGGRPPLPPPLRGDGRTRNLYTGRRHHYGDDRRIIRHHRATATTTAIKVIAAPAVVATSTTATAAVASNTTPTHLLRRETTTTTSSPSRLRRHGDLIRRATIKDLMRRTTNPQIKQYVRRLLVLPPSSSTTLTSTTTATPPPSPEANKVYLGGNGGSLITLPDMECLAYAIKMNGQVEEICLANCFKEQQGRNGGSNNMNLLPFIESILSSSPRALKLLNLHGNELGPVHAETIGRCLGTGNNNNGNGIQQPLLESLHIDSNRLGNDGVRNLLHAKNGPNIIALQILDLSRNGIAGEGFETIGSALKEDGRLSIKWLRLSGNTIMASSSSAATASPILSSKIFSNGLKVNQHLMYLELRECYKDNPDLIVPLIDAVFSPNDTPQLKMLDLGFNNLNDAHATLIAKKWCTSTASSGLESLLLWNNSIGDVGAFALAKGLRHNLCLNNLTLVNNPRIGMAGCKAFSESLLYTNYAIEQLQVKWNHHQHTTTTTPPNAAPTLSGGPAAGPAADYVLDHQPDHHHQYVIDHLCIKNRRVKKSLERIMNTSWVRRAESSSSQSYYLLLLPITLFPMALEKINQKPDLIFATLKSKLDDILF